MTTRPVKALTRSVAHQILADERLGCVEHALNRIEDVLAPAPVLADDALVDAAEDLV